MKQNEKILLCGGVAVAAFVLYSKARALSNLVFSPGQITDMGFRDGIAVADFSLLAQNTSTAGLTINSFAGNVFANDFLVGNVYNFYPVHIVPNGQTYINVSIAFKPLGIVQDILRAFQYNNFSQEIKIQGFANVSGLQLPVNLNLTVGNPANPPL